MKFFPAQFAYLMQNRETRRNLRLLRGFLAFLLAMVVAYSVAFHFIMAEEQQQHSWVTGFYWTLTVMSTLGFGDITFRSDLGRVFSMVVLLSGVVFLLILLPFTFIQFFYAPWLEAQSRRRAPRQVPEGTRGHVIVTHYDAVAISLVQRLADHGRPYWVLEPEVKRALDLHDAGIRVVVGERDELETYRRLRAGDAALVVVTGDDYENTNIAFTVRELTPLAPIVSVARAADSVDILELAGSSHVLHLPQMLGRSLARRTLGGETRAGVIGRFGELVIAEAPVSGTPLAGRTLRDGLLRQATGLTVVGVWERGSFGTPGPDDPIGASAVLVLAGSDEQLARFEELTVIYNRPDAPVLVLGGGRVGRAVARALREREVPVRIVEQDPARIRDEHTYVVGSAADLDCLEEAGIREAGAVVVTTSDDATNIFLTIYCRRLRPDLHIVSRSTLERNVSTLHRAGADFVMSYASMGANAVFNVLEKDDVVMLAEGLDVFRYTVSRALAGRALAETRIRETTGCSVVAVQTAGGTEINPPADRVLPAGGELILVGTTDAERAFVRRFGS